MPPQLLQAVWSRAALQAGSCLGLCSQGASHIRTSSHIHLTCQRAGAGQAALLWTVPPAAWGLPLCTQLPGAWASDSFLACATQAMVSR